MILDIFLPEYLRGTRLLSKKVTGFSLEETSARMLELTTTRGKSIIHSIMEESIAPTTTEADRLEATIKALSILSSKMPKCDYIRIAIPSSLVLFKELKVPLKSSEKIRMVIGYEVESMLPFPLHESIIDFVITRNKPDEDFTHVLVAAVRKQDLNSILEMYQRANINPTHVTVDLLAFYAMYHAIPDYNALKDGSSLVDVSATSTRVAFLQDGELRLIRTIPKGITTLITAIEQETKVDKATILQRMTTQSLKTATTNDTLDKSIQKNCITFLNDIQFTLNSFSLKLNFFKDIQKILFLSIEESLKGFCEFAAGVLQTPCEPFAVQKLFEAHRLTSKIKPPLSWNHYALLIGVSVPPSPSLECDLLTQTLKPIDRKLFIKQLSASIILITLLFGYIVVSGFLQIRTLNSKINTLERQEVSALKKTLMAGRQNTRDDSLLRLIQKALNDSKLPPLLKKTKTIVDEEERSWLALAHLKINPLELLHDLTSAFDRKNFLIKTNVISLETVPPEGERIIVNGFLKSKNEEHFQDYAKFKQHLAAQKDLILVESDEGLGEEEGVKFTLTFKPKDRFNV